MEWFRWYTGTCEDGKTRVVARKAGVTVPEVIAVWAMLLEDASRPEHRGVATRGAEFIGAVLDIEEATVGRILDAMRAKPIEMIAGAVGEVTITKWADRQYETDQKDPTNAERQRRFRERKRVRNATVTAGKRSENDQKQKTDTDTDRSSSSGPPVVPRSPSDAERTPEPADASDHQRVIDTVRATNRAMVTRFGDACRPIPLTHGSIQFVHDWLSDGIPSDAIHRAIDRAVEAYQPGDRSKQPKSMAYFDSAVRDEWDRTQARKDGGDGGDGGSGNGHARGAGGEAARTSRRAPRGEFVFEQ